MNKYYTRKLQGISFCIFCRCMVIEKVQSLISTLIDLVHDSPLSISQTLGISQSLIVNEMSWTNSQEKPHFYINIDLSKYLLLFISY